MSDLFISYARENRATAEALAAALAGAGLSVWWDRELKGGHEFATAIEKELADAGVVVVLWSDESIKSGFVRDESSRALEMGKLLPVRIEEVALPLGFGQIHTLDLIDWDGDATDEAFQDLVHEARSRLGRDSQRPVVDGRRLHWKRSKRWLVIAAAAVVAIVGGFVAFDRQQSAQADGHFRSGLEQQFAREPNLESARNFYLDALAIRPGHARASFYLGHVYAQLGQPDLARTSFERALVARTGLDAAQEKEARDRVAALAPAAEPIAVARAGTPSASLRDSTKKPLTTISPTLPPPVREPEAATLRLPQVPPPADVRQRAEDLVQKMFGASSDQRIAATTSLVTSPDLLSDAVPIAVEDALEKLARGPAGLSTATQSGVINTLVLLQAALPGTLNLHRASIERLLAAAKPIGPQTASQVDKVQALLGSAASRRPVAFIQIANEAQRPIAESLAVRLRAAGYDAPGIENVGTRAPEHSAVRVQGKSERGFARWISKIAGDADGEAVAVQTLRNVSPGVDTYEIWFDRDLCQRPERMPAGCRR